LFLEKPRDELDIGIYLVVLLLLHFYAGAGMLLERIEERTPLPFLGNIFSVLFLRSPIGSE